MMSRKRNEVESWNVKRDMTYSYLLKKTINKISSKANKNRMEDEFSQGV